MPEMSLLDWLIVEGMLASLAMVLAILLFARTHEIRGREDEQGRS